MTLQMLKQETYNIGFAAGEEQGIAIGKKLGEERGRNEGIAIGEKRGISLGITQGAREAKLETAKSMKSENMPVAMIAHFTGLSPEEIEKL